MSPTTSTATPGDAVGGLIDRAIVCRAAIAAPTESAFDDLTELKARLATERLQIAVLGQFKRGKSTLLNALLGAEVLPMGVLPVTAIPTFIEYGATPSVKAQFRDGRSDTDASFRSRAQLKEKLAELVTEDGNPSNRRGVARVTLRVPSSLLARNVVLIDTPGVGSTHQHNTEAAKAALPASDAALFVVSPDPPITEVEVGYLGQVRATAGRIVMVLNKADMLTPAEADRMEAFLHRALAPYPDLEAAPILRVSARAALAATLAGDPAALGASGLPALESFLTDFLGRERRAVLALAVRRKAGAIVGELRFQAALRLKALQLPLDDLERRAGVFNQAMSGFESERRLVDDIIAADRKRALDFLESEAAETRAQLAAASRAEVGRRIAAGEAESAAWFAVQEDLPNRFEAQLAETIAKVRRRLDEIFAAHHKRVDDLIDLVNRTAAELLDTPFRPAARGTEFEAKFLPYWQLSRPEALNPLPPGAFDPLLPPTIRRRHALRRIQAAIDDVTIRNVENLRWAMRRNLDEAFRRFSTDMNERFNASLTVTRGMMIATLDRRRGYAEGADTDIASLEAASKELEAVEGELGGEAMD